MHLTGHSKINNPVDISDLGATDALTNTWQPPNI